MTTKQKIHHSPSTEFRKGIHYSPATQFKKGHTPWNKGIKGKCYSPATAYKKGHLPWNTLHDGTITIRTDTSGAPYKFIRISLAHWIPLHRHTWIQKHGRIPKGHVVKFINNNTLDCRIKNLELITMAQNLQKNRFGKEINNNPNLKKIKQLNLKLRRTINEKLSA